MSRFLDESTKTPYFSHSWEYQNKIIGGQLVLAYNPKELLKMDINLNKLTLIFETSSKTFQNFHFSRNKVNSMQYFIPALKTTKFADL